MQNPERPSAIQHTTILSPKLCISGMVKKDAIFFIIQPMCLCVCCPFVLYVNVILIVFTGSWFITKPISFYAAVLRLLFSEYSLAPANLLAINSCRHRVRSQRNDTSVCVLTLLHMCSYSHSRFHTDGAEALEPGCLS